MKKTVRTAVLSVFLMFLCACVIPVDFHPENRLVLSSDQEVLREAEVRIAALEYKCQFENYYKELYGEDFWDLEVKDGLDYETYVKEFFIYPELKTAMYLSELAKQEDVKVSAPEEERLKEASSAWYMKMTEDERLYTGASEEDIYQLLHRYLLAEKMIEKLLEGKKTEISEEESRAVDFQVIRVSDQELADDLSERLSNGESFLTLASLYSENTRFSYSAAKGELAEELEEVVFSMKENEISPVIPSGDHYYLIRMVNTRNTLLSINQQENQLARKRFEAWKSVYDSRVSEGMIRRNEEVWQSIRLKCEGDYAYHSLFDFFAQ